MCYWRAKSAFSGEIIEHFVLSLIPPYALCAARIRPQLKARKILRARPKNRKIDLGKSAIDTIDLLMLK